MIFRFEKNIRKAYPNPPLSISDDDAFDQLKSSLQVFASNTLSIFTSSSPQIILTNQIMNVQNLARKKPRRP